jgi:hypothetical protein
MTASSLDVSLYGRTNHEPSPNTREEAVTRAVKEGINSRFMDFGALAQYGLPGAGLAVVAALVYTLIKRGFRVSFRAEVPRKRME